MYMNDTSETVQMFLSHYWIRKEIMSKNLKSLKKPNLLLLLVQTSTKSIIHFHKHSKIMGQTLPVKHFV